MTWLVDAIYPAKVTGLDIYSSMRITCQSRGGVYRNHVKCEVHSVDFAQYMCPRTSYIRPKAPVFRHNSNVSITILSDGSYEANQSNLIL